MSVEIAFSSFMIKIHSIITADHANLLYLLLIIKI